MRVPVASCSFNKSERKSFLVPVWFNVRAPMNYEKRCRPSTVSKTSSFLWSSTFFSTFCSSCLNNADDCVWMAEQRVVRIQTPSVLNGFRTGCLAVTQRCSRRTVHRNEAPQTLKVQLLPTGGKRRVCKWIKVHQGALKTVFAAGTNYICMVMGVFLPSRVVESGEGER